MAVVLIVVPNGYLNAGSFKSNAFLSYLQRPLGQITGGEAVIEEALVPGGV